MFETLGITVAEFERFLLVSVRIITLFNLMPLISSDTIDIRLRILMGLFLAMMLSPLLPIPSELPVTFVMLIPYAMKEVLIGFILGTISKVFFEALNFAGSQVSRMMNLSMISLVDPTSQDQTNAVGQLFYFFGFLLLFTVNGHHFFIQAIIDSFYHIPLTTISFQPSLVKHLLSITSEIFIFGLQIGAPIYAVLFIERVLLGLFAKVSPDMQVMIVAMPLAILMGFYLLVIFWPYFTPTFFNLFEIYKKDFITFQKLLGGS